MGRDRIGFQVQPAQLTAEILFQWGAWRSLRGTGLWSIPSLGCIPVTFVGLRASLALQHFLPASPRGCSSSKTLLRGLLGQIWSVRADQLRALMLNKLCGVTLEATVGKEPFLLDKAIFF